MSTVSFKITRNDISPKLTALAGTVKNPTPVFRAMGTTFKSITEGNFNSIGAKERPSPWAKKKDGSISNLKKSGLLWHSFHLEVTDKSATLSNPTPYAATHQFGRDFGRGAPIPARPFFPVLNGKLTPSAEEKIGRAGERAIKRQAGV